MYSSYTAASFAREHDIADQHGVNLEGALTWAFEFEDQPYFAGFRALATEGIDLPVLNVFRMFSKMDGQRVTTQSDHAATLEQMMREGVRGEPDVAALASLDAHRLCVMVWHYHDDDVPGPAADIDLELEGLPGKSAQCEHFAIDATHSNSYAEWQRIGSPEQPTTEQIKQLEQAGKLASVGSPAPITIESGKARLHATLARQAVSLFVISWK